MALYYLGCGEDIVDPVLSDCPTTELGDIRSVFIVNTSFTFTDITSTAEWTTGINNRDIYVYPYAKGSLDIAENEQPGFGDQPTTIDGYEFTINSMHPDYAAMWPHWNSLKKTKNWKVGYRTETQVHLSDNAAQINAKPPIGEDKKGAVLWNVVFKFSQDFAPRPYDMPTGVFDEVIAVS
jgi:hypothetical protein